MITCDASHISEIHKRLQECLKLLEHFEWLINSFVLDFFLEDHWESLPSSWRSILATISPSELADWLDPCQTVSKTKVWPLSLLAFKEIVGRLSLERRPVKNLENVRDFLGSSSLNVTNSPSSEGYVNGPCTPPLSWEFESELLSEAGGQHSSLGHVFRKHVKPKKQYEMCRMAKLVSSVSSVTGVGQVLDIGAGVGHLARYLCYNNSLAVGCVDGNINLTGAATKFDSQLEASINKMKARGDASLVIEKAPVHVTYHLSPGMDMEEFHSTLEKRLGKEDGLLYSLIGLHTCGDLNPVLLKIYCRDDLARFLTSVGCCYMKIVEHFPMSRFLSSQPWHSLHYVTNELACHAIEIYCQRLRGGEDTHREKLKIHCYRAVLEKLLVSRSPEWKHTILKTVTRGHELEFPEYVQRATANLVANKGLQPFTQEELTSKEVEEEIDQWWKVVTFYSLRLALAPIIETVLLLDRCLFLYENGQDNLLLPIFDPLLSPRNQVLIAAKSLRI